MGYKFFKTASLQVILFYSQIWLVDWIESGWNSFSFHILKASLIVLLCPGCFQAEKSKPVWHLTLWICLFSCIGFIISFLCDSLSLVCPSCLKISWSGSIWIHGKFMNPFHLKHMSFHLGDFLLNYFTLFSPFYFLSFHFLIWSTNFLIFIFHPFIFSLDFCEIPQLYLPILILGFSLLEGF